jgi:transcriptional regulator with XRE-family HTH domain
LELRKAKNLTQQRLAIELGIDQASVSSYESGKYFPTVEVLIKLAKFFSVSTDYLLGLSDVKVPQYIMADEVAIRAAALFHSLPPDARDRVLGYIDALKNTYT